MLANILSWRYYRRIFRTLPLMTYEINGDQVYGFIDGKQTDFIWFMKDNSFCLVKNTYLFNAYHNTLDPYAYYWRKKYINWCKENIKDPKQFYVRW